MLKRPTARVRRSAPGHVPVRCKLGHPVIKEPFEVFQAALLRQLQVNRYPDAHGKSRVKRRKSYEANPFQLASNCKTACRAVTKRKIWQTFSNGSSSTVQRCTVENQAIFVVVKTFHVNRACPDTEIHRVGNHKKCMSCSVQTRLDTTCTYIHLAFHASGHAFQWLLELRRFISHAHENIGSPS